jgi:hypothetical protein
MTRDLILLSNLVVGFIACSDVDKGPGYASPVLSCSVEGMANCETRVLVRANPGVPPFIEFGAYDLNGPIDSGFAVLFSSNNVDSAFSRLRDLQGEVRLNDYASGQLPMAEFIVDKSSDDIKIWYSRDSILDAVYDEESRTLQIEWDLELEQIQPMMDPQPLIRAKGKAISPVYVRCWKPIGGSTSILDENFETEYCKPWKEFHTPARFPDL